MVIGMPSHYTHKKIDKIILGKEYPDVHKWIDEPVKWLGPRHRILRHDIGTIALRYYGDRERTISAYMHLITDKYHSKYKRRRRK